MRSKIIWKFLAAYIALILVSVFVLNFLVGLRLRGYYESKIAQRLESNALLVGEILDNDLISNNNKQIQNQITFLSDQLKIRITIIDTKGNILGDSQGDPKSMESHQDRLEVIRAIADGVGESNRFSDTLGYNMKYVAVAINRGDKQIGIVRLALPLDEVESQIRFLYSTILLGGIVTIFFALVIGYFTSKKITEPINRMEIVACAIAAGDYKKRVDVETKDEVGDLAISLNKMADELEKKINYLNEVNKIKTDFVANVSHELKTPLTSIQGFIETLEDGAIDDKENAFRFVGIIKKHAQRLNNIVDDLLQLSQIELDKNILEFSKFNIKELIDEVILGFGHAFVSKKHIFHFSFYGDDFNVVADKAKIEQVLVNLIDNAIKYTEPQGEINLNIKDDKDKLLLIIEDNGIGIDHKHLGRIFERFYRVDKARSTEAGGTGLGLAIVKHIVTIHKGTIDVQSKLDIGTKIAISLPKDQI